MGEPFQPATIILLKLFDEGHDKVQRGQRAPEELKHASDYLRTLDAFTRGLVVIDLLTLQQAQKAHLLKLSMPEVDDGGTEGAVDAVPEGPVE